MKKSFVILLMGSVLMSSSAHASSPVGKASGVLGVVINKWNSLFNKKKKDKDSGFVEIHSINPKVHSRMSSGFNPMAGVQKTWVQSPPKDLLADKRASPKKTSTKKGGAIEMMSTTPSTSVSSSSSPASASSSSTAASTPAVRLLRAFSSPFSPAVSSSSSSASSPVSPLAFPLLGSVEDFNELQPLGRLPLPESSSSNQPALHMNEENASVIAPSSSSTVIESVSASAVAPVVSFGNLVEQHMKALADQSLRREKYFWDFMIMAEDKLKVEAAAEKEEKAKQTALISKAGREAALKAEARRLAEEKAAAEQAVKEKDAAIKIQSAFRGFSAKKKAFEEARALEAQARAAAEVRLLEPKVIVEDETEEEARAGEATGSLSHNQNNNQNQDQINDQREDLSKALVPYRPRDVVEVQNSKPEPVVLASSQELGEEVFSFAPIESLRKPGDNKKRKLGYKGFRSVNSSNRSKPDIITVADGSVVSADFKKEVDAYLIPNALEGNESLPSPARIMRSKSRKLISNYVGLRGHNLNNNQNKEDMFDDSVFHSHFDSKIQAPRPAAAPSGAFNNSSSFGQRLWQKHLAPILMGKILRQEKYLHDFMGRSQEKLMIEAEAAKEEKAKQTALISKAGREAALKAQKISQEKADRQLALRLAANEAKELNAEKAAAEQSVKENEAAIKIQSAFRGFFAKKNSAKNAFEVAPAVSSEPKVIVEDETEEEARAGDAADSLNQRNQSQDQINDQREDLSKALIPYRPGNVVEVQNSKAAPLNPDEIPAQGHDNVQGEDRDVVMKDSEVVPNEVVPNEGALVPFGGPVKAGESASNSDNTDSNHFKTPVHSPSSRTAAGSLKRTKTTGPGRSTRARFKNPKWSRKLDFNEVVSNVPQALVPQALVPQGLIGGSENPPTPPTVLAGSPGSPTPPPPVPLMAQPKIVKKPGKLVSLALSLGYDKVFGSGVLLGFNAGVGYDFGSIKLGGLVYKNKGLFFVKPRIGYAFRETAFGVTPGLMVKRESVSGVAGFDGKTTVRFMPGAFIEFKPSKRFTTTLSYDFIPGFSAKNSDGLVVAKKSAEHKISVGFKYNF